MTTRVTDNVIEVAGRRLNPRALAEWQLLLTHLEISEGFSFVVLLVPDSDWANACRLALSHSLDVQDKSLLTVNFSGAADFEKELAGRLLQLSISKRIGAVWLEQTVSETSDSFSEWQDAWRGLVARLNQLRNPLQRHFQVPLVFVGANWLQPLIRENAPDLWSVRTLVTRVQPPDELSQRQSVLEFKSEHQLASRAIDPDLALRTAERLRCQDGQELVVAELLFRAGQGRIARSQWSEAEVVLRKAIELQREFKAPQDNLAESLLSLGQIFDRQYRFEQAVAVLLDARALFAQSQNDHGEGRCLYRLSNLALHRSDYNTAKKYGEEALRLFRRLDDPFGKAQCIEILGDIALELNNDTNAQARYDEALDLYRSLGKVLGEANCFYSLGHIAKHLSDYHTAQARFEEALSVYRRVGEVLGEANCIQILGEIASQRSDYATAQARYEEALPLYRRVGSILGEANCIQGLGDIALRQKLATKALEHFVVSLRLFEKIAERYSIGWANVRIARLASNPETREPHLQAAREAWTQIDRPDLIERLERDFNTVEKQ